ncbi:histone deacetylase 11 isoform X2 [Aplysia californica]|uniref:Histone deacetylase 11 isoform X2 n=1 Tax=Aplysia californica TaxID=6500 RepID=A0ABM0JRQ3_APLCA|nr:histone deacetylase 11 isoform X2 [Aplysia californica]
MAGASGKTPAPAMRCRQYEAEIKLTQWPIIYSSEYNIGFCGLEKLHPFDAGKWGRIFNFLKDAGMLRDDTIIEPMEASETELLLVHTKRYISSLRWSMNVAGITEVPPVALLPNFVVQKKVLRPFRFQTSGTIMAGRLALDRGWAINIGGGFHHCSAERGGGFCAYADITLAIKFAFEKVESVAKVMIIDLDAHQGNGHERDFMNDQRVYILDVYNRGIYPHDGFAKRAIKRKVELGHFTDDETYLTLIRRHVDGALNEFEPDLVVYNAGTDILEGDPLGNLSITAQGVIERDQIVFQKCRTRGIPIFMVTSGGYQRETARIVADSILNLKNLGLISWTEAENAPLIEAPVSALPRSGSDGGLFARFKRSCLSRPSTSSSLNIAALVSPSEELVPPPTLDSVNMNAGTPSLHSIETNVGALTLNSDKTGTGLCLSKEKDFFEPGTSAQNDYMHSTKVKCANHDVNGLSSSEGHNVNEINSTVHDSVDKTNSSVHYDVRKTNSSVHQNVKERNDSVLNDKNETNVGVLVDVNETNSCLHNDVSVTEVTASFAETTSPITSVPAVSIHIDEQSDVTDLKQS